MTDRGVLIVVGITYPKYYMTVLGLPFILTHFCKNFGFHQDGNNQIREGKRGYGKEKRRKSGRRKWQKKERRKQDWYLDMSC